MEHNIHTDIYLFFFKLICSPTILGLPYRVLTLFQRSCGFQSPDTGLALPLQIAAVGHRNMSVAHS